MNDIQKELNNLGLDFKNPNKEVIDFAKKFHDFDLNYREQISTFLQKIHDEDIRIRCFQLLNGSNYLSLYDNLQRLYKMN